MFPETVAAATAYVNAVQADTRPKCAAYQTRTNTGTLQTVTLLTPVALPNVGDQATGALLRIVGRAQGTYVFEAVLRAGAQLAITVVLATSLPTPEFLRAVAGRAATRLR